LGWRAGFHVLNRDMRSVDEVPAIRPVVSCRWRRQVIHCRLGAIIAFEWNDLAEKEESLDKDLLQETEHLKKELTSVKTRILGAVAGLLFGLLAMYEAYQLWGWHGLGLVFGMLGYFNAKLKVYSD
jgi:hypothetical protein